MFGNTSRQLWKNALFPYRNAELPSNMRQKSSRVTFHVFIIPSVNTLLKDGTHFVINITVLENIIILRLLVNVVFATGVQSAFTNVKKNGSF